MKFWEETKKVKIAANAFIADHEKIRIEIAQSTNISENKVWVCVIKNPDDPTNRLVRGKQIDFSDFGKMLYKYLGRKLEGIEPVRRKKSASKT